MTVIEDLAPPPKVEVKPRGISRRERWQLRLPLLPALIYTIVVTQIPFLVTLWYSFQSYFWNTPAPAHFTGLSNYKTVFTSPAFRGSLVRSVVMTVTAVIVAMILGVFFAILLDRKFLGRSIVRTLIITPFLVMPVAAALVWAGPMLDPNFGLVNYLLQPFGVHHVAWLSSHALGSVILVMIWQWTPFMTLIVLAGLQSQPSDTLEAAKVDGAGAWATFGELTLPHLRPYIELGILLGSIYLVNVFERGQGDDPGRPRHCHHQPALLPVPAGEQRLRYRRGGRHRGGHRHLDHHRGHVRAADVRPGVPVRGGRSMTAVLVRDREPAGLRLRRVSGQVGWGILAWVVGIAFFLPVLWMLLTAFKPESAAQTWPPKFIFTPTLAQFRLVFSGWGPYVTHSLIATTVSTLLVLALGVPAAYALSVHPVPHWRDGLFFFISTKMLPIVAAIGPLYVLALKTHLLDSIWVLIILYTAMNLPVAIWLIRSFMLEVPKEMLEAAELDGAGRIREMTEVIMPVISPGLVSTALICVIFAWNELFLALNLTVTNAATLPMFLISSVPQEGLYLAHLSAAATVASVPVIIIGWIAQRSLVRGLSMGAIK